LIKLLVCQEANNLDQGSSHCGVATERKSVRYIKLKEWRVAVLTYNFINMPPRSYTIDDDFRPGQLFPSGTSDTVLPAYSVEESAPTYKAKTNKQILAETIKQQSETYEADAARATQKSQSRMTSHRDKYRDLATYNTEMAKFGRMASKYMQTRDLVFLTAAQESYKTALAANSAVNERDTQHVSLRTNALSAVVFSQCPDPDSVIRNHHRSRMYWSAYRQRGK